MALSLEEAQSARAAEALEQSGQLVFTGPASWTGSCIFASRREVVRPLSAGRR